MNEMIKSARVLNKQLEIIFETSSDGIWVCDADGTIVALNKASERLNGVSPREVIGRNVSIMTEKNIVDANITPDVIRTRQRISRMQYIKQTGRRLMVTGSPAFDDNGNLIMVVVNEHDMTELEILRKKLKKSQRRQEQAMNQLASFEFIQKNRELALADNPAMLSIFDTARKLARHEVSNILVTGETGTGKGMMSGFIQKNSPRKTKPFVKINCAALPENLLEAELFGYEKGAFTGAGDKGKPGLFELADKGILFLDEIGDMPLAIQSKLLKYLDDYEVMRLGGVKARKIDCLILSATNQDLRKQVAQKRFRQDLLHRINNFTLRIPPLRDRQEDVFIITNHFLAEQNRRYGMNKRIGAAGMALLQNYQFPGNIRELRNIIEEASVVSKEDVIDGFLEEKMNVNKRLSERDCQGGEDSSVPRSLQEKLDRYERELVQSAAKGCRSSVALAKRLGTSQATAFRKMKKFGISLK